MATVAMKDRPTHCLNELSWVKRRLRLPPELLSVFAVAFPRRRRSARDESKCVISETHASERTFAVKPGL